MREPLGDPAPAAAGAKPIDVRDHATLRSPAWIGWLRLLCVAALGLSLYLFYLAVSGGRAAGCGEGGLLDCHHVIQSKWSNFLGLPVSLPAAWAYLTLLLLSGNLAPRPNWNRRFVWGLSIFLAAAIASAAAWFVFLQIALLHAFCLYCSLTHALGLAVAALILRHVPVGAAINDASASTPVPAAADSAATPPPSPNLALTRAAPLSPGATALLVALGFASTAIMAAGAREKGATVTRLGAPSSPASAPGAVPAATDPAAAISTGPNRRVMMMAGKIGVALRPHDYPVRGSADAPVIVVELFDYTCPHCRTLHAQLEQALDRYPGQLGVVLLPVPLESGCNPRIRHTEPLHAGACELARLALAVWKADRAAFGKFDAWLFQEPKPRTPDEARAFAAELLGAAGLERALADPWAASQVERNATLYDRAGGGSIPKLLLGSVVIQGRPAEPEELFTIMEKELGLKPSANATKPAPSEP